MARQDNPDRQIRQAEKERRSKERSNKFWKTFLFTEEGKPKSGFGIYTFFLSFVFLAFYVLGFHLVTEYLTDPMDGWPVWLLNLVQSLTAGAFGAALVWVVHRLLPDKRLALGGHLWLCLYAVVVFITLLILMRRSGALSLLFTFFGWFVLIPLCLGLGVSYLLYRRDYRPPESKQEGEEPWKKYVQRR